MSINYLWKFYLENDLESFQHLLLLGTLPSPVSSGAHGPQSPDSSSFSFSGPNPAVASGQAGTGACQPDVTTKEHSPGKSSLPKQLRNSQTTSKGQKESPIVFTQKMIKQYDFQGRSLIHLTATDPKGLPFLKILLTHREIEVNHPDVESGWTAFHRALYHGNITAAKLLYDTESTKASIGLETWPPSLVRSKDKSGEAPFDVFEASIEGLEDMLLDRRNMEERVANAGSDEDGDDDNSFFEAWASPKREKDFRHFESIGDEVFTFGSNKNHTLGFADQEDRRFPDRLTLQRPRSLLSSTADEQGDEVNVMTKFKPLHIQDIQLSKLHTAILTSDAHSNLYVCGFGHGGRLGFGDELTQFTPRLVSIGNKPYRVVQVALGLDHTVAVLSNGEVWTWGGNKYGQLGYSTKLEADAIKVASETASPASQPKAKRAKIVALEEADYLQATPRQVTTNLKRECIAGAAASRIHTVIHTRQSLFAFGKNEGQLGIIDSPDDKALAFQTAPRKVAASFLNGTKITMVAATEKSTIILLEKHEVWILANYGYGKIQFPIAAFGLSPSVHATHVTKLTCGKDTLCALTNTGDVFTIKLGEISSIKGHTFGAKLSLPTPVKIWSSLKKHLEIRDLSVGEDGNVIVCTKSGSVWRRTKRTTRKDFPTPAVNVGTATANSTIASAFSERKSRDYKFSRVSGLTRVVAVAANDFGSYAAIRRDTDIMRKNLNIGPPNLWNDIKALLSFRRAYFSPNSAEKDTSQFIAFLLDSNMENILRGTLAQMERENNLGGYDMVIKLIGSDLSIPVHKAMVTARCPLIRQMVGASGKPGIFNVGAGAMRIFIPRDPGSQVQIILEGMHLLTILILIYYIYSDTNAAIWNQYAGDSKSRQLYRDLRAQLSYISKMLHMREDSITGALLDLTLDKDLEVALSDPDYLSSGDLIIQLKDDVNLRVHSIIMRQRSPFFQTLYEGTCGRWLAYKKERMTVLGKSDVEVDLKHISLDVFKVVLLYIYTDKSDDLFENVKWAGNLDAFLDFIIDTLAVANELLMDRLSMICQTLLGSYVNTRNACQLLSAVAPAKVKTFKDMCLQYICLNLETMLENGHLDDLDDGLLEELCEALRKDQRLLHPVTFGGKQKQELLRKYPDMVEGSEEERKLLIKSYTYNASQRYLAVHDDPRTPLGSLKSKSYLQRSNELATSPVAQWAKSKPTSNLENWPSIDRPVPTNEDIFDIEDISTSQSTLRKSPDETHGSLTKQRAKCVNFDEVLDDPAPGLPKPTNTTPSSSNHHFQQPTAPLAEVSPWPWGGVGVLTPSIKLDMKEIMAEASTSSNRKPQALIVPPLKSTIERKDENLTTSLPYIAAARTSQKERKRQQMQQHQTNSYQQHQTNQHQTNSLSANLERSSVVPWQTTSFGPRVSLKDILSPQTTEPAASDFTPSGRLSSDGVNIASDKQIQSHMLQLPPIGQEKDNSHKQDFVHFTRAPLAGAEEMKLSRGSSHVQTTTQLSQHTKTQRKISLSSPVSNKCANATTTLSSSSSEPSITSKQNTCATSVSSSKFVGPPASSFPPLGSTPKPRHIEPSLHLSLADIISQQQAEQDIIKGKVVKRPLAEIQAEQEFMDWWEKESRRVQGLPDSETSKTSNNGNELTSEKGQQKQGGSNKGKGRKEGDDSQGGMGNDSRKTGKGQRESEKIERLATLTINLGNGTVEHNINTSSGSGRGVGNRKRERNSGNRRGGPVSNTNQRTIGEKGEMETVNLESSARPHSMQGTPTALNKGAMNSVIKRRGNR